MKIFPGWREVGRAMRWARQQTDIVCDRTLMPFPIYDLPGNEVADNRWRRGTDQAVTVTHHIHLDGGGMDLEVHAAGWQCRCEPTSALQVLRVLAALDLIPDELTEDDQPRIVIEDDTARVTGYTDPTDVVGALLTLVESVTGVSADSYARLCDEVHRRAEQLPDDDRIPVEVCECDWLGAGTPAHAPTGFCRDIQTDSAGAGPASAPTTQESA